MDDIIQLPIVTIIGRPNVGKSTLFNYLTKTKDALVVDMPGVTRDRQYGEGKVGDHDYWVVDTGGINEPDNPDMAELTDEQVKEAMDEADILLFLVDAKSGVTSTDSNIANIVRRDYQDKTVLLMNKADNEVDDLMAGEFYKLGLGEPVFISATRGRGIKELMESCLAPFPKSQNALLHSEEVAKVAVVGRPNVGKSTLINRILGEERVVVFDQPGTTRDSIFIPFERREKKYTLIDTAGVRRRSKVTETVEKFSILKTLLAMRQAHVVVLVLDAKEGLTDQDMRLLGKVVEMGKALVLAFNKWDGMDDYERDRFKQAVDRRLQFADYARRYFISALHGTGVGKLFFAIDEAYDSACLDASTAELTRVLEKAVTVHQPPLVKGRRVRLRYAHLGGHHPLVLIIHGKQTTALPASYLRFLSSYFRKTFNLMGVPLQIHCKSDDNPYAKDKK